MAKVDIFLIYPWESREQVAIKLRLAEAQAYCQATYPNERAYIEQWEGDTVTRQGVLVAKFKWRPNSVQTWRTL